MTVDYTTRMIFNQDNACLFALAGTDDVVELTPEVANRSMLVQENAVAKTAHFEVFDLSDQILVIIGRAPTLTGFPYQSGPFLDTGTWRKVFSVRLPTRRCPLIGVRQGDTRPAWYWSDRFREEQGRIPRTAARNNAINAVRWRYRSKRDR